MELDDDGTLYIVDAAGNCVHTWRPDTGLQTFLAWLDNPVPTALSFGPRGDIYGSFLSPAPFPVGGARIERYNPDGKLTETFGGLTTVVDVLATSDGTVYAVEFVSDFSESGWKENSGRVISVSSGGVRPVAEGLSFPYHLALDPNSRLVVRVNSAFSPPYSG